MYKNENRTDFRLKPRNIYTLKKREEHKHEKTIQYHDIL